MPVVNYHTVNGQMVGQSTGTTFTQYLTDALGSVTATVNGKRVSNTYRYKPYGERLAKTGTGADPDFQWTGDTGSRVTGRSRAEQYNQARHNGTTQASWTSVDPIWPNELAYVYASMNPTSLLDYRGLSPLGRAVNDEYCELMNKFVYEYCNACYKRSDQGCRTRCHILASEYYNTCKRKRKGFPAPGPGPWSPPPGGHGDIAPRPIPEQPRDKGPRIPLPAYPPVAVGPHLTPCCILVAGERAKANHDRYGGSQDHLMHCVFYCQVWKLGCPMPALASEGAEAYLNKCKDPLYRMVNPSCLLIDEIAKRFGLKKKNIISHRDYVNNQIGIGCSQEYFTSCEDCCMARSLPGGSMDEGDIGWL